MSDGGAVQMRILDVLQPAEGSEWDALVQQHPEADVFHSSAWARVIHDSYRHRPLYIHFHSADEPVALVPLIEVLSPLTGRRAVCLPFTDACGPLLFQPREAEIISREIGKLSKERSWNYFEIRGDELLGSCGQATSTYYGHILRLAADSAAVFARFSEATRRAIRRAEKNNLSVEVSQEAEAVQEFYDLHVQTRRKHGLPPQPFGFFGNIHRHLVKAGFGFTVLVRAGNHVAAGAIFLLNAKRAIYKFAASDPERTASRGNNLVIWEGIQHIIRAGCEKLHFGRTSLENRGLRRFKGSWGAEEHMIRYYRFEAHGRPAAGSVHSRETGLHQHLFRRLPQGFNRLAGAVIYPHLD